MKTASFFVYTGPGRVSIARRAPRNTPAGFRIYKPLAPGPWFNSVTQDVYRERYFAQLADLDATHVCDTIITMAHPHEPVLLCYENKHDCAAGKTFCHRHMVAEWFKATIGLDVIEL